MAMQSNTSRRALMKGAAASLATTACAGSAVAATGGADPVLVLHARMATLQQQYRDVCKQVDELYALVPEEEVSLIIVRPARCMPSSKFQATTRAEIDDIFAREKNLIFCAPPERFARLEADRLEAQRAFDRVEAAIARRVELGVPQLEELENSLDDEFHHVESKLLATRPTTLEGLMTIADVMAEIVRRHGTGDQRVPQAAVGLARAMRQLFPANG